MHKSNNSLQTEIAQRQRDPEWTLTKLAIHTLWFMLSLTSQLTA